MRFKKELPIKFSYLCSGIIIFSGGLVQMEISTALGVASVILGMVILGYFLLSAVLKRSRTGMDAMVNFLEGVGYLIIGLMYYEQGKLYIQYAAFAAAAGFITASVILCFKTGKPRSKKA